MKNKTKIFKIVIDVIMLVLMILLMSMKTTGETLHEILGIGIGVAFIIHIILNFKWIKSMTKNLFNKQVGIKSKILYVLNIILAIFMIGDIISGVLISESLFPNIAVGNRTTIIQWHNFASYWLLIIMAIHLGFHWNMVVEGFNKIIKEAKNNIAVKIILKVMYAIVGILGIIGLMKQSVNKNFAIPGTTNQNDFSKSGVSTGNPNQGGSSTTSNSSDSTSSTQSANTSSNSTQSADTSTSATDDKNTTSTGNTTSVTLSSTESVDDYLGNLHCTGCGRHCVLTSPQCQVGVQQAQVETQNYNASLATSQSTTNSNSTSSSSSTTSQGTTQGTTQTQTTDSSISTIAQTTTNMKGNEQGGRGKMPNQSSTQASGATGSMPTMPNQSSTQASGATGSMPTMPNQDSTQAGSTNNGSTQSTNIQGNFNNGERPDFNNNNKQANNQEATITDYISIMGFVVGGTYYVLKVIEKAKKKAPEVNSNNDKDTQEKQEKTNK